MEYVEDSLILFDKIDGRYVSVEIYGDYEEEEVIAFYKMILPNLGWREKKSLIFNRNNETLEIICKREKEKIQIKIQIKINKRKEEGKEKEKCVIEIE